MSAFICSDNHIGEIAAFAEPGDEQYVGQALLAENIKSYEYRYKGNKFSGFEFKPLQPYQRQYAGNPVQILKLIASLRYQSCEHPDYETSPAYAMLGAIEKKVIRLLPGWEEAQWTI